MSARPGLGRLGLHQRRRDAVGLAGRACFHVLSVVKWLTRWTVENSSCSLSPAQRVAGFFFCHSASSAAQMARLVDSGSSKNFALMCAFLLSQTCNRFGCSPWRLLWHYLSMSLCDCQA